jgi:F0F1-type ATP synthase assembly protein I
MPAEQDPGARPSMKALEAAGLAWALGWPIAAGVLAGYWIDEQFGTAPVATLIFSISALALGVRRLLWLLDRGDDDGSGSENGS